jgi:non-specific serine/threonine protein kinase
MKSHQLVFDLSFNADLHYFIPRALIVEKNVAWLGYFVKNANPETLQSYEIELDATALELLHLCELNQPTSLLKKYNAKNKTPKPLKVLMEGAQVKRVINQYIELVLGKFLHLISKSNVPISFQLDKEFPFTQFQIFFADEALQPKLYFHKTEELLSYRLRLLMDNQELIPFEHPFKILLNEPAFVLFEKKIFSLNHINANKLKPFLNKEVIEIPKSSSVTYFNSFIKSVVQKVAIEAEGFEVITLTDCLSCLIKPTTTIFSPVYQLELFFVYEKYSFSILDNKQKHIRLEVNENEEFTVFETKRNMAYEAAFVQNLKELEIVFLKNNLATFHPDLENIDTYFNISKLMELKTVLALKQIHFNLQLHRMKINDQLSTISTHFQESKDWFDLEMTVETAGFKISFTSLVPNLKSGERLFSLPDGTHFLIPLEWFSRFKSLVHLGTIENDKLLIQKNQYMLLQEADIITTNYINEQLDDYEFTGNVKATLRAYQNEGVNWLVRNYQRKLGSCLADDMGLGKTLQTLTYLDFVFTRFHQDFGNESLPITLDLFSAMESGHKKLKALIVSPSSLTFNWLNESRKFCPHFSRLRYVGLDRKIKQKAISNADLVFTSYSVLLRDIDFLKKQSFHFIIIDESQQIKNRNSKIYKALSAIEAPHKVSLSGTPIENSLSDLWSQMQFINPNLLGSYSFFDQHFKKPIEKNQDEAQVKALKLLIDPFLMRRTKAEVAKDLPELSEQIFYTKLSKEQAKLYEKEKSKVRNYLIEKKMHPENHTGNGSSLSVLNALMKLRQLANHPKLIGEEAKSGKFEDVSAYLETLIRSGQKTLVFSSFTSHLKIYTDWCDQQNIKYCLLTGQTDLKNREKEVNRFENETDCMLFFISLKAGGTGLNLTSASFVIILDPWWNPFAELQAIGRAHRIGQRQKVHVIRFIANHTIEEKINLLQQSKKELSNSILESQINETLVQQLDFILD